jgi:Cytochrome P450
MVMQDIEVDGYRLQAGTVAIVAIHALHRDPTLWDDPLTFDPDRFNPQRSKGRDRWRFGNSHPARRNRFSRRRLSDRYATRGCRRRCDSGTSSSAKVVIPVAATTNNTARQADWPGARSIFGQRKGLDHYEDRDDRARAKWHPRQDNTEEHSQCQRYLQGYVPKPGGELSKKNPAQRRGGTAHPRGR